MQLKTDLMKGSHESSELVAAVAEGQHFDSVAETKKIQESQQEYQDTIQRLKDRVNSLQDRLAMEERKADSSEKKHDMLNQTDTVLVQNRIESMRLNFDLLEQKLGQEQ